MKENQEDPATCYAAPGENIILSEMSQSQKDGHCVIPLTHGTWNSQIHSKYSCQGLKAGTGGWGVFNGYRVSAL